MEGGGEGGEVRASLVTRGISSFLSFLLAPSSLHPPCLLAYLLLSVSCVTPGAVVNVLGRGQ